MFKFFRKKDKSTETSPDIEKEYVNSDNIEIPAWYDVGAENPFNQPILDLRCITLKIISTTRDKSIAENFNQSRRDIGEKFIGQEIPASKVYTSSIRYPHNGSELEGIVYKADSMDVKWDIYAYGEWFYFVRSWTSDLIYKVHYINTENEIVMDEIHTSLDDEGVSNLHEQNINSVMLTHVLNRVWPYTIPKTLSSATEKDIALRLFSQFGCKATLATHADTLTMKLKEEEA